jgi:TonB family protein
MLREIHRLTPVVAALTLASCAVSTPDRPEAGTADASDVKPVKVACRPPQYPLQALRAEKTGLVGLAVLISPEGRLLDAKLLLSSGSRFLDEATLEAFRDCKFKPSIVDGKPAESWTELDYTWALDDSALKDFRQQLDKAGHGDPVAQYAVSLRYAKGIGAPKNAAESYKWALRAAENGEPNAQYAVAGRYRAGSDGAPQDSDKADEWMHKAAGQGQILALQSLRREELKKAAAAPPEANPR